MARDSGNTVQSARSLNLSTGAKARRETIGANDIRDFFKFNLTSRSSFDLTLSKLRSNVDVALLNNARRVVASSRQPARKSESIRATLEAGTYYIRLDARGGATGYELRVAAIPASDNPSGGGNPVGNPGGGGNSGGSNSGGNIPNTAPAIAVNLPLSVSRQGTATIGRTNLLSSDTQQSGDQLLYQVIRLPAAGALLLNEVPLVVGDSFTQTDIDNNRLTYRQNSIKPIPNTGEIPTSGEAKISGSNVVWAARESSGDTEIFLYGGSTGEVTQITRNSVDDTNPQISGANVVWQSNRDGAAEIYLYNSTTRATTRLTNDTLHDSNPKISDRYVVWQTTNLDTTETDVKFYSLSNPAAGVLNIDPFDAFEDNFQDAAPAISGSNLVFHRSVTSPGGPERDGIYFADLAVGRTLTQVSSEAASYTDRNPQISGSLIAWERVYVGGDIDINYKTSPRVFGFETISVDPTVIDELVLIPGSSIVFYRFEFPRTARSNDIEGYYLFNPATRTSTRFFPTGSVLPGLNSIDGNLVGWTEFGTAQRTANLYNLTTGTSTRLNGGAAIERSVGVSGGNAAWLGGSSLAVMDRLFFYDGSITSDSFGFSVSDSALTTNGAFNIAIG
ncbi:cadherin-like domain-containing protein [Leptolyngbya ohadii]|uniref:cadherin-like domain-containing protein n=1 Tax=Leptolyngbya ohadii TaxID=1962290 RepID=UPI000B59C29F|nr:cadherin-like domain-containing protein [Leptolyngbya ohadii]